MCGRYTLAAELEAVAKVFEADAGDAAGKYRPRYNVAPGQDVLAVTGADGRRRARFMRWGFPAGLVTATPRRRGPWINARAETVAVRPAFRESFLSRRCLVPADGFFEWEARSSSRRPYWLHPRTPGLLAMAGIWTDERGPSITQPPSPTSSLAVLTRAAPSELAWLHDRVPLVLPSDAWDAWLSATTRETTLRTVLGSAASPNLLARPVSPAVNNARFDDPACLDESVPPPEPPSLF